MFLRNDLDVCWWIDWSTSDLLSRCAVDKRTVFPSRSSEQNWSEPEIVPHFTSCGRSHMQRDCLSCCRVKCVHVLCGTSGNQLVPGFDCAPVRCSLCAVKIWLEALSLHTVRGFWQSCTVCSCRSDSSLYSPPLSSSSPSLFCSWESDFSLPCHCYSLAKPEPFSTRHSVILAFKSLRLPFRFWLVGRIFLGDSLNYDAAAQLGAKLWFH